MTNRKIEVVGQNRRRKKAGGSVGGAMGKFALRLIMHPASIGVGVLTLAGFAFGTPHVAWEYGCAHPRHSAWSECRQISWCAYYGFQGRRTDRPDVGERCDLIRLMPIK
ncbi:hypothetical protein ACG74X_09090 [Marivita sp. S0852]|uniref:hypothetical protein n=1 Tax=Marivita sp. S0852 TaxID=3373893 RepID=UPI0039821C3D